ncbi:type IV pilus modification protein PilV [Zhongshania guokunii]|uniref:Type IV pilus modification protein PilV n=1 Tax=Zhongshania guokunii TaxID=641783 RepID=A0ABV3U5D9_9GAMM
MTKSQRSAGYSLIEVLVALLVTATGVMGSVATHLNAIKFNQTADVRSHATLLAYEIVDRMRANRNAALAGDYTISLSAEAPSITPNTIAQIDLQDWFTAIGSRLTAGDGAIAKKGNIFTVTVQWDESRISRSREANADGGNMQAFIFSTEL